MGCKISKRRYRSSDARRQRLISPRHAARGASNKSHGEEDIRSLAIIASVYDSKGSCMHCGEIKISIPSSRKTVTSAKIGANNDRALEKSDQHSSATIVRGSCKYCDVTRISNYPYRENLPTTILRVNNNIFRGKSLQSMTNIEWVCNSKGSCIFCELIRIFNSSKKTPTTAKIKRVLSRMVFDVHFSIDSVLGNLILYDLTSIFNTLSRTNFTIDKMQQLFLGVVLKFYFSQDVIEMLLGNVSRGMMSIPNISSKEDITTARLQQILSYMESESNFSPGTVKMLLENYLFYVVMSMYNNSSKESLTTTKIQVLSGFVSNSSPNAIDILTNCIFHGGICILIFSPDTVEKLLENSMFDRRISMSNTSSKKSLTKMLEYSSRNDTEDLFLIFCGCNTYHKDVYNIFEIVSRVFAVDDDIAEFQLKTQWKNVLTNFGDAIILTIRSLHGNWHLLKNKAELLRNCCDRTTRIISCICHTTSNNQIARIRSISQQTKFMSNRQISYPDIVTDSKALENVDWYYGTWSHLIKNCTEKSILIRFNRFACEILLEQIYIKFSIRDTDSDSREDNCVNLYREKEIRPLTIVPLIEAVLVRPSHRHSLHLNAPRKFNHTDVANSNDTDGDFTDNEYLPLYREKVKRSFTNANFLESNQLCQLHRHNLADIEQFPSQKFYHKDVAKSHFPEHFHVNSMILRETLISNFETELFDYDIYVKDTKNLNYLFRFQTNTLFPQILDVYPVRRNDLDFSFQQILSGVSQTSQEVMRFELQRFASFQNYDYPDSPSAFRFAKAGWYATGNGKETACFVCNVRFTDWVQSHNPMDIHRQLSPSCPFLIGEDVEHVDVIHPSSQCERTQSQEITDNLREMQLGERPGTVNGHDQLASNRNPGQETTFNPALVDDTVDSHMLNTNMQGSNRPLFNGFRFGYNASDSVPHSFREDVDQSRRQTNSTATNFSSFVSNDCPLSSSNTHHSGDGSRTRYEADTSVRNFPQNALVGFTSNSPNPCRNGGPNTQTMRPYGDTNNYQLPSPLTSNNTPMFPAYKSLNVRISSYQGFPAHVKQTPRQLAQAGFFYRGFGDRCSCFWCGIGLQHWETGDDPWVEHAHRSHRCQYVIDCKGESFITLVQEALIRPDPVFPQPVMNPKESLIYELREMGFLLEAIHCAIKTVESNGINLTLQTVANAILENMSNETSNSSEPDRLVPEENTQQDQEMAMNVSPKLNSNPVDQSADANSKSLSDETAAMKEQLTCKICLDANVGIVFLPCGHIVACVTCSVRLSKCPICRKFIREKVKTLM